VSFAPTASAAFLSAALMLKSTRMPAARRRLLGVVIPPARCAPLMLSTLTMVTSAFDTPAAAAIATLKIACLPASNSVTVIGIDTAAVTT